MKETYSKGIAFVFEGDTEKYFYINFLEFLCKKYEGWSIKELDADLSETYLIEKDDQQIIIRTNTVGTITQITNSGYWFNNACANKYSAKTPWVVFLCYDTDSHTADISKFYSGDWKNLRTILTKRKNIRVVDIAASADIEDLFLTDLESISNYLELEETISDSDVPRKSKGKNSLKLLFRKYNSTYHEGYRALPLIEALNKQTLIDSGMLPLDEIENVIFK